MPRTAAALTAGLLWLATACANAADATEQDARERNNYFAPRAATAPLIDGIGDEQAWATAAWQDINHRWLGPEYSASDFQGRYKVIWSGTKLYILSEIVDDILLDAHRDPLVQYWDDDCLEVFIDEDFSGGDHQYNHNAFAYHISLDNRAIDIGTDKEPRDYSHHVESRWKQHETGIVWELAIEVYTDRYQDSAIVNVPATLSPGKIMGLMVAYCDNDGSELRENFIGSVFVPGEKKDRGWIDAGVFGSLTLTP